MFRTIRRIINWTGHYKKRLYIGFIYSFLISVCSAIPIVIAAYSLNRILMDEQGKEALTHEFVLQAFILIVVFILLKFFFSYLRAKSQESIGHEVTFNERIRIGEVLKRVPLGFFAKNSTGDLTAMQTSELSTLELMSMKMIDAVVNGYIFVFATISSLMIFSIPIALLCIAGVLLSGVFLYILNKFSSKSIDKVHRSQEEMAGAVIEYIRGMGVVKSFGKKGASFNVIKKVFRDNKSINIKVNRNFALMNCLHLMALHGAAAGIIWMASSFTLQGQMEIFHMVMMLMFSFSIFAKVEGINDAAHILGTIDDVLDHFEEFRDVDYIDKDGIDVKLKGFNIEFDDVSFSYDNQKVIKNVSFKIPTGSKTAIIGPSGSGKTTLCNLIARFYNVDSGEIRVGGRDVKEFTCDSLLTNISMVFQKVYLFHDTIENNIRFGKPDASMEEIKKAAKLARCHHFISNLENGYHTFVGEGGSSLSGGEKQRISIARAILKNAPIIILDEATSSIDPENEGYIQSAIAELTKGKTVIIIAHRLTTVKNADQIIVLDKGELSQRGSHETLIKEEGIYRQFLKIRREVEGWSL